METTLSLIIILMIIGAIYALNAKDLLSAVISVGIVGYSLVICFLLLKAPDLAIVQIVVETITLVFMIAVVLNSTRDEIKDQVHIKVEGKKYIRARFLIDLGTVIVFAIFLVYLYSQVIYTLEPLGEHSLRMSEAYVQNAAENTGSANLVTGVLFDYRGYDTLGEATVLFTAVIGVLTILRIKGKKWVE